MREEEQGMTEEGVQNKKMAVIRSLNLGEGRQSSLPVNILGGISSEIKKKKNKTFW